MVGHWKHRTSCPVFWQHLPDIVRFLRQCPKSGEFQPVCSYDYLLVGMCVAAYRKWYQNQQCEATKNYRAYLPTKYVQASRGRAPPPYWQLVYTRKWHVHICPESWDSLVVKIWRQSEIFGNDPSRWMSTSFTAYGVKIRRWALRQE